MSDFFLNPSTAGVRGFISEPPRTRTPVLNRTLVYTNLAKWSVDLLLKEQLPSRVG